MKKLFLLCLVFITFNFISYGQCPTSPISLTTQAEVDAFATNYPGCTELNNDLIIEGHSVDIINLLGLSQITSVAGELNISFNYVLDGLEGLENITTVNSLFVGYNDLLDGFEALTSLTTVNGDLKLFGNNKITSLSGLNNINSTLTELNIDQNYRLTDISNIQNANISSLNLLSITYNSNLEICNYDFICDAMATATEIEITQNALGCYDESQLNSECGVYPTDTIVLESQSDVTNFTINYPGVTSIENGLVISGNDIVDLNPLSILNLITGDLIIKDNALLSSLDGLENMQTNYDGDFLMIKNNPNLTSLSGLIGFTNSFRILIKDNPLLESLLGLSNIINIQGYGITIDNNDSLINLLGLENIRFVHDFYIVNNDNLINTSGLDNIEKISDFKLENNASLLSIEGFIRSPLIKRFRLVNNPLITDISKLEYMRTGDTVIFSGHIEIINNPNLTNCSIYSICSTFYLGNVIIENNGSGCSDTTEVQAQCPSAFPGEIWLSYQEDVDNFSTNYPGCTVLAYNINISGSNIANLNGLSHIDKVYKEITIEGCPNLTNVNGLEDIEFLGPYGSLVVSGFAGTDLSGLDGAYSEGRVHIDIKYSLTLNQLPNFGVINYLRSMYIRNNSDLQSLDGLENLQFFENFNIYNNSSLTDISSLEDFEYNSYSDFGIGENENLSNCSILTLCNYLEQGGANMYVENNNEGCNTTDEILENCLLGLNNITGNIKNDIDLNGCDSNDTEIESVPVNISNATLNATVYTNDTGNYLYFVETGTYTVGVITETFPNYNIAPSTVEVTFNGTNEQEIIDFCLSAINSANDLKITLISLSQARPGFDTDYQLIYENIGTTILSGDVTLQFDDARLTYLNATPSEDNIAGNIITWNYTDLLPFESRSINIEFNTLPPPTNDSGDVLVFEASINPISGDENSLDNVFSLEQTIVNSQDPNDKQVMQGSEIYVDEVGRYLDYIVRFQNVGTADAINVRVDDLLSENLNWNTFRPLSSSHEYQVEILDGNQVSFIFDDIYLPSEDSDPEGSQGYVAFQVRSLETLSIGDVVVNSANIFFDFNDPILTNTVITTVVDDLGISAFILNSKVNLTPNPVSESLTISVSENITFKKAIVYSILGEKLIETSGKNIHFSNLPTGIYFVDIETDQGSISKKIVKD